jgi:hypothetical protein
MAEQSLEAMALADASVHMHTLQHIHAKLALDVKSLILIKVPSWP